MATNIVTYESGSKPGPAHDAEALRHILSGIPDMASGARGQDGAMPSRILRAFLRQAPGPLPRTGLPIAEPSEVGLFDVGLSDAGLSGAGFSGNEVAGVENGCPPAAPGRDRDGQILDTALALLRYAQTMMERAEKDAAQQATRIAQLETLATTDDLTGLKNRRGFLEAFGGELDRCGRGLSAGGLLVLIDLDNFKAVNDTYGYLAGDACLRLVAATLAGDVRLMDTAARLGGDEFVLLLSNTTREKAAGRAQKLAWRLNRLSLAWEGELVPVRASLGLKDYRPGDSADGIFRAADDDLYKCKEARRETDMSSGTARAILESVLRDSCFAMACGKPPVTRKG